MRKALLTTLTVIATAFIYILLTAQKKQDQRFYYAFDEKIFISEMPGKFLVKAKSPEDAKHLTAAFEDLVRKNSLTLISRLDNIFIVQTSDIDTYRSIIKNNTQRIAFTKSGYIYQQAELFYADEIVVEPKSGHSIAEVLKKLNLGREITVTDKRFYSSLKVPANMDALDLANRIQETGLVVYSHPDFISNTEAHQVIPNDTYFNNQFYLRNTGQVFNPAENHAGTAGADIRASWAWTFTTGNNAVIVAVIDEGVTGNHPDLPNTRQVRLNGSNFAPGQNVNDPNPTANDNHGNSCAGIIAATQNNNEGISGIAPNVRIMPVKIGFGFGGTTEQGLANAIDFAWQNGAAVISNSWGFNTNNPNFSPVIVQAINRAVTQGRNGLGSVVAFSASNSATHAWGQNGQVRFPSNVQINGVLTVGASDRFDQQADYSPTGVNGGANNQVIDIVAPSHRAYPPDVYGGLGGVAGETFEVYTIDIPGNAGYNVWNLPGFGNFPALGSTLPNAGVNNLSYTGRMGGTSASCPQVAAVAALVLSIKPDLTQQQVFNILAQTADDVGGYVYTAGRSLELGNGRLDACEAVTQTISLLPASTAENDCYSGTFSAPALPAGTVYNWQVSGDLLIDGVSTSKSTTDNFVNFSGSDGSGYVSVTTPCGTLQWWMGYTPHQRQIQGLYPEYICGDHVSVSVNTTPYDTYYRWYINNTLVKEGPYAYYYCTCYYETPDPRVSGDNTIRVEVETGCGVTSSFDGGFFMICGYYRTQSNVELFPNPARDQVTIRLKQVNAKQTAAGQLKDIREVRIVDKLGVMKKLVKYASNTTSVSVNLGVLPSDVYYVEISDGRNSAKLPLSVLK